MVVFFRVSNFSGHFDCTLATQSTRHPIACFECSCFCVVRFTVTIIIFAVVVVVVCAHLDPFKISKLNPATKKVFLENVQLVRDAIVFFTSCGAKSGYGGHTGAVLHFLCKCTFSPRNGFANYCPPRLVRIKQTVPMCFTTCHAFMQAVLTTLSRSFF